MTMDLFHSLIDWYVTHINYYTVTGLMAVEASFIPFPSEAVIPVAAYKAAQGDLNIFLVVFFGTVGAMAGSLFNYYFALYLGRPFIYRFAGSKIGRLLLLSPEGIEKAEKYFVKHGKTSTLIGRLVPGVRQLISLPAGLARMNMRDFLVYTFIGACLWNIILAVIGYYLYEFREEIFPYLGYILLALGAGFALWLVYKERKKRLSSK
jgi:membrane protein DedA with SNARE-associated domain